MRQPYLPIAYCRGAFFCVGFLSIWLCNFAGCSNVGSEAQNGSLTYLKQEYEQVQVFPGSSVKRPNQATVKGWHGLVSNEFTSNASSDQIKAHYQKELLEQGWQFCRQDAVIYRNQDFGGQHVFYRKGIYMADLQLAGKQASEFGWTYAFSMSWGVFDDVQCVK